MTENQEITWLLKEKYQGVECEAFYADVTGLKAGVPLAYLIGYMPFLDTTIHLDSHPLIPRPETEYWVEQAITAISNSNLRDSIPKILDLCAGSGAVGVAVAKMIPQAYVTFAEIDPTHLPTIKKNIATNVSTTSKVRSKMYPVIQGDLFENMTERFDFILTNPPYIDIAANTVDLNVTEFEPHLALFGGTAGMEIITRIILESPHYLTPGGQLWIEHEPFQSSAILELASAAGFTTAVTHPDQYGVLRFSVLAMAQ